MGEPRGGSTNPFPRRHREVDMGEPVIARKLVSSSVQAEGNPEPEVNPFIFGNQPFRMNAPDAPPSPPRRWGIQAKLTIGQPNDVYEQEADRVAEQVMGMDSPATPTVQRQAEEEEPEEIQTKPLAENITPLVQRQEMLEEDEPIQAKCEDCEAEEPIQRFADGTAQAQPDLENRLNASQGGGSALPDDVRSFMEPRFNADFSQVRVHTGSNAVQMSEELSAQAFTHKQDVYFGVGKAPGKNALTAHELTHVVQQTGRVQAQTVQRQSKINSKALEAGDTTTIKGKKYVVYENEIKTGGSLAWINNNPGNITYNAEAEGYGAYKNKKNGIFAIFPDEGKGFYAIIAFLEARKTKNIAQMMNLYAPSGHGANDPGRYADSVAKQLGVTKNTKVSDLSDEQLSIFASAIQTVEGWKPGRTLSKDDPSLPESIRSLAEGVVQKKGTLDGSEIAQRKLLSVLQTSSKLPGLYLNDKQNLSVDYPAGLEMQRQGSIHDQKYILQAPLLRQISLENFVQRDPADLLDAEHDPQSASAILSQLNPPVMKSLGEYCNTNCPATASAVSHYLATGEIKAAHCNKLAEDQGYDVSDNEFTKSMKWQQANGFINQRTPKHGSFVVVEGDRGDKPPEGLTRWHYFTIVNIHGKRFVVDAFGSGKITSNISSYASSLKTKLYKLVKGEFKVTPVRKR